MYFGGEILGLPLEPHCYCPDWGMYGVNDYDWFNMPVFMKFSLEIDE